MLRYLGSLSNGYVENLKRAFTSTARTLHGRNRSFCSGTQNEASAPELLFQSPNSVINIHRLIGISVYSQVLATCVFIEQMMFPSKPSKYSWGVQATFASGLLGMSVTMPMVYFFAIRRNIFEVSILRHQRQLILKHLGKSLSVMESKVSLDEIEPVTRLSKHLRLIVRHPETGALDTLYLNRSGKYLNRDLLEQISKGYLSKTASQEVDETATNIAATARKYAIRPKRLIKDAAESAEDKPNPTV